MGWYQVDEPCAFMSGGRAVHYTRPGAVVEVDDDVAAPLVKSGKLSVLSDLETRRREAIAHHKVGVKRATLVEYRCRVRKCLLLRVWQTPNGPEFYAQTKHAKSFHTVTHGYIDVRGQDRNQAGIPRLGIPDIWAGRLNDHPADGWVPLICDHHQGAIQIADIRRDVADHMPGRPSVVLVPFDTPS